MVSKSILIPPPLNVGDSIAVVAVSGPPDPDLLDKGIEFLNGRGFATGFSHYDSGPCSYLAGSDDQRCRSFNGRIADPEIKGIFLARGGYGSMRILENLDIEAVSKNPKIILGMSDVTALQLSLYRTCGLATFSGPMIAGQIATGLDAMSETYLLQAITTDQKAINFWPDDYPVKVLRGGQATGPILGGCLSMICALMGTLYLPDFSGSILVLEDISEPPYKLDRMLTQLKLGGLLDEAAAIVLGHFLGPNGENLFRM